MLYNKLWSPVLVIAAGLCLGASCSAAEIEQIVITENFRQNELFRSAGSVSVIDAGAAAARDARHLEDTLRLLPNVSFSSGGGRVRFVQVRGIGDLEQFTDPKHYPSVGVVVDDIELGSGASGAALLDLDRIELLRGPQGTRFGASAAAGMLNLRTRQPGDTFSGRIEAGYGNKDSWVLGGVIGGPLRADLAGRLAVQQYRGDGFSRNSHLDRDDTGGRDEFAAQGKMLWSGPGSLRIGLAGYYADLDNGYDAFSLDNTRITQSDQPGRDAQQTGAGALHADWEFGNGIAAQAIVTFASGDSVYAFDEDWVYTGYCAANGCSPALEYSATDRIDRERTQWSADARLLGGNGTAWTWVAGVYFQQRGEDLERTHYGIFTSAYDSERLAVYGQLLLPIAGRFEASTGIRLEQFRDEYSDSNALARDSGDTFWSGELTFKYFHSEHTLWYATLSRGVKPGGVNTEASSSFPLLGPDFQSFAGPRLTFEAERLWHKELGLKGRYFDDRLALRLALFHMARREAQLESWLWDATNYLWVGLIDSVAAASNYGAELEFELRLGDRAKLFGGVGQLHTNVGAITVFDLDAGAFIAKQDRDQAKAPRWQYHFGIELRPAPAWHWRIEVEGRAKQFFGYYHDGRLPAYTVVNASLSHDWDLLRARLWVRNLGNKDHAVHGLYFGADPRDGFINHSYWQYGEPRAFGINFSYEWP